MIPDTIRTLFFPGDNDPLKNRLRPLALIFLIGLAVRLLYLLQTADNPTFLSPVVDANTYDHLARQMNDYHGIGKEFFRQGFFYPFFLGCAYLVGNGSIIFAKLVQALIGSLTCVLTYQIAHRLYGRKAALCSGLIIAFYGPLLFFEADLLATGLTTFLVTAVTLLFLSAAARPLGTRLLLLGIVGGLLIVTRGPMLAPFAASLVWLLIRLRTSGLSWRQPIRLLALPLGLALVLLPVALKCYQETGKFSVFPAQAGLNLYLGNNPDWIDTVTARPGPEWESILLMPYRDGAGTIWEHDDYFRELVEDYLVKEPALFAKGIATKALAFFNSREFPRNYDLYLFRHYSSLLSLLLWKVGGFGFPFGVLLPLAVMGLWAGRKQTPLLLPLFVGSYALVIILVFISSRYRTPIIPLLAIPAGGGLIYLIDLFREGNRQKLGRALLAIVTIMVAISIPRHLAMEGNPVDFRVEMKIYAANDAKRRGKPQKALELLREAVQLAPDNPAALANLATELLVSDNDYNQAEKLLQKVLQMQPRANTARTNLGVTYYLKKDYPRAIQYLAAALAENPDNTHAVTNLANAYYQSDHFDQAIGAYRQAVELNPWDANSAFNLGMLLSVKQSDSSEALKYLHQARRTALLIGDQELFKMINQKIRDLNTPKETPLSDTVAGSGENPADKYIPTIARLRSQLADDPTSTFAMIALINIYRKIGDQAKEDEIIELMLKNSTNKFRAHFMKGRSLQSKGKRQEAIAEFVKAGKYLAGKESRYLELAKAFSSFNDYDNTRKVLTAALNITKKPGLIQYMLGVNDRHAGLTDQAIDHYEKALELLPNHQGSLNDLAVLYVDSKRNVDRGIELAEKLYTLSNHHPRFGDVYGWVLMKAGRAREAIPILEAAAKAAPNVAVVQLHLKEARELAASPQSLQ